MNTHTPRAQQHRQVQSLAVLAMFTAILFLLTFTPIGMIDLPIIKATVLHVPVIIGALLLGPKKGAFLGGMFGLASLLKNTLVPNLSSFAFSPLIPVPGLDRGSPWALVVCFVPRILVGVTPWLVYTLLQALSRRRGSVLQAGSMALSAVVGAFTNTALVMGLIALLFRDAYACLLYTSGVTFLDYVEDTALAHFGVTAKDGTQLYKDFDMQVYYSRYLDQKG